MEEGALSGRKGTGLFWSKNNEREKWGGGGGVGEEGGSVPGPLPKIHHS